MEEDLGGSEKQNTVHTLIDRVLVSRDWEAFSPPQYQLRPASTAVSDHCPLILKKMQTRHFRGFRMEQFLIDVQGFEDIVQNAWLKPVLTQDCIKRLHVKIARPCRAQKKWGKELKRKNGLMAGIVNSEARILHKSAVSGVGYTRIRGYVSSIFPIKKKENKPGIPIGHLLGHGSALMTKRAATGHSIPS